MSVFVFFRKGKIACLVNEIRGLIFPFSQILVRRITSKALIFSFGSGHLGVEIYLLKKLIASLIIK